jgi:hypothetical protein
MLGTHAWVGTFGWSIVVVRLPRRLGSTPIVEPWQVPMHTAYSLYVLPTYVPLLKTHTCPQLYHLNADTPNAPWTASMPTKLRDLLGTDPLGTVAIGLLNSSLAPSTYANYDNALRQYLTFCAAERVPPLHATPTTVVRYTAWLGLHGTLAAGSMQRPYFSAVNKYPRDHQLPSIAV